MTNDEPSAVDTGPPDDNYEDNLKWLVDSLPGHLNRDPGEGNHLLYQPIATQMDALDADIEAVDDAKSVQRARTRDQVERLASTVNLPPEGGESLEHYRARTLARFQLNTAEGDIRSIFGSLAEIFDIDFDQMWYADWNRLYDMEKHVLFLPYNDVKAHPLTDSDIPDVTGDVTAAGKTITAMYDGSLTVTDEATYNSTDWTGFETGITSVDDVDTSDEGGMVGGLLD